MDSTRGGDVEKRSKLCEGDYAAARFNRIAESADEEPRQMMDEELHYALINALTERARGLEAVKLSEDARKGSVGGCMEARRGGGDADGNRGDAGRVPGARESDGGDDGKVWRREVLARLRELTRHYLDRVTAWREVVRKCERSCTEPPLEGDHGRQTVSEDPGPRNVFRNIMEDIHGIIDRLRAILTRLDEDMAPPSPPPPLPRGTDQSQTPSPEDDLPLTSGEPSSPHQEDDGADAEKQGEVSSWEVEEEHGGNECPSPRAEGRPTDKDSAKEPEENSKLITVGLPLTPDSCCVQTPAGVSRVLQWDTADALSCLMVTGAEELVSRVVRLRVRDGARVSFPVAVVIPFHLRYRGNCRDVAVKVVDDERRVSYISPATSEGSYGGQRGSFAEVKVYALGLFAVVSCLRREGYTVPRRGLSLKLAMDPRVCLSYPPGSFTAPVVTQTSVQPLDAVLLATVKSKSEDYRSVVSTSPIVHLTHPLSQGLRRPLTVTLPCAPKPRQKTRQLEQIVFCYSQHKKSAAAPTTVRILHDITKTIKETHNELLVLLGYKDEQWSALEKITVKNQQKGLVSFELTESFDRLIVVRLRSPLSPCRLARLVEDLEEAVCCHAVTVALLRQKEDPRAMLVALVPSRDLCWELSKLRAQGYGSTTDSSPEITMSEGDQLLLRFRGNVTPTESVAGREEHPEVRIAFHSQRTNHLAVRLTEVDPFGNHSSSHYKGTAVFHKVLRGQLDWTGPDAGAKPQGDPVCKLPLTLPKREKESKIPTAEPVKICEDTSHSLSDSLLLWLSGQLSAEELSLLVVALRLRRSAAQLVKLRAGGSLSAQAFHLLLMWRRALPAVPQQSNLRHLAQCLAKSGRPDLAGELLLHQAPSTSQAAEEHARKEEMDGIQRH